MSQVATTRVRVPQTRSKRGIKSGRLLRSRDLPNDVMERVERHCTRRRNGCLIWTGAKCSGHGVITVHGQQLLVRRVIVALRDGACPSSRVVISSCRDKACVRDIHLVACTVAAATNPWMRKPTRTDMPQLVIKIRKMWPAHKPKSIAEKLGLTVAQVIHIGRNETWFDPHYTPVAHRGCEWGYHKLTKRTVTAARKRWVAGSTIRALAEAHGVAYSTMWEAVHNTTWQCVDPVQRKVRV